MRDIVREGRPFTEAATLDDTTKKTGDAGGRVACAVLQG